MNRIFTIIDLRQGFHQMPLAPEYRPYTAFWVGRKRYQWKVMPMGIKNAGAFFQRMMDEILGDLEGIHCYIDNILVGSCGGSDKEMFTKHYNDVRSVLEQLRKFKIIVETSKVDFFTRSVQFCGHILEGGTRKPAPGKLMVLERWEKPTNIRGLRGFLGLCNFYSHYVKDYGKIAGPLMDCLKGISRDETRSSQIRVRWTPEADECFGELKKALLIVVPLQIIDHSKSFHMDTDATKYAVWAVLQQVGEDGKRRPIAFHSRKVTGSQIHWSTREKECYAIISALEKWESYIGRARVDVRTDHLTLKAWNHENIRSTQGPSPRQAGWHEFLSRFHLHLHYLKGRANSVADPLSRLGEEDENSSLGKGRCHWVYPSDPSLFDVGIHGSEGSTLEVAKIKEREKEAEKTCVYQLGVRAITSLRKGIFAGDWSQEYPRCPQFGKLWWRCQNGNFPEDTRIVGGKLVQGGRYLVPRSLASKAVQYLHDVLHVGSSGKAKLQQAIKDRMVSNLIEPLSDAAVERCSHCQMHKVPTRAPPGGCIPGPMPHRAGHHISLDVFKFFLLWREMDRPMTSSMWPQMCYPTLPLRHPLLVWGLIVNGLWKSYGIAGYTHLGSQPRSGLIVGHNLWQNGSRPFARGLELSMPYRKRADINRTARWRSWGN